MDPLRGLVSRPRLLVGDLAVVGFFLFLGVLHHGGNPVAEPLRSVDTFTPFLVGWLVSTYVFATYSKEPSLRVELVWVVLSWILADSIALGLRSTSFFHGGAARGFIAVSLVGGGLFLVVWRLLHWLIARFMSPNSEQP